MVALALPSPDARLTLEKTGRRSRERAVPRLGEKANSHFAWRPPRNLEQTVCNACCPPAALARTRLTGLHSRLIFCRTVISPRARYSRGSARRRALLTIAAKLNRSNLFILFRKYVLISMPRECGRDVLERYRNSTVYELASQVSKYPGNLRASELTIHVGNSASDADIWDSFAQRCGASFRCAYYASWMWQLEYHPLMSLVRLDLFLPVKDQKIKIGQCAIGVGAGRHVFCDAIQLLPQYRHLWSHAMQALLDHLGPGDYRYGSDWCLDECRSVEINGLAGTSIVETNPIDLLTIDFSRWKSFDAFYEGVSKNARRNVQKAEQSYPGLVIRRRRKWQVFRDLLPLELSRYRLFKRKHILTSRTSLIARSACRVIATYTHTFTARILSGETTLARFMGISFGPNNFFMEAAADDSSMGAASYLLKAMIETAYKRTNGAGKFVFGPDDHSNDHDPVWQGLTRSRLQWQAEAYSTSIVHFSSSAT